MRLTCSVHLRKFVCPKWRAWKRTGKQTCKEGAGSVRTYFQDYKTIFNSLMKLRMARDDHLFLGGQESRPFAEAVLLPQLAQPLSSNKTEAEAFTSLSLLTRDPEGQTTLRQTTWSKETPPLMELCSYLKKRGSTAISFCSNVCWCIQQKRRTVVRTHLVQGAPSKSPPQPKCWVEKKQLWVTAAIQHFMLLLFKIILQWSCVVNNC